jgi:exonuclease SbcD
MIRLLHTADWHLGKRLKQQSLLEEQQLFLEWLLGCCVEKEIDYILMAGDLFDVANPPQDAEQMYYSFLARLGKETNTKIIITGGNHDSIGAVNGIRPLAAAWDVILVGEPFPEDPSQECFPLYNRSGEMEAVVAATPFLREKDFRLPEGFEGDIEQRLTEAHRVHYRKLADHCNEQFPNATQIGMGHLFADKSLSSDSERQVGTLNGLPLDIFPESFAYVALGHIHKPQSPQENRIIYSGSPNMLSFSETEYAKRVVLLEASATGISSIESVPIPVFRKLYDWTGTFQEIQEKIDQFENPDGLVPWIKINVREEKIQGNEYANLLEMIQIAQQSWNGSAIILDHSLQFTANHPQAGMHQAAVPADSVTPELIFDSTFHRDHFEHIEILKEIFDGLIEEIQMNEGGQY